MFITTTEESEIPHSKDSSEAYVKINDGTSLKEEPYLNINEMAEKNQERMTKRMRQDHDKIRAGHAQKLLEYERDGGAS